MVWRVRLEKDGSRATIRENYWEIQITRKTPITQESLRRLLRRFGWTWNSPFQEFNGALYAVLFKNSPRGKLSLSLLHPNFFRDFTPEARRAKVVRDKRASVGKKEGDEPRPDVSVVRGFQVPRKASFNRGVAGSNKAAFRNSKDPDAP